MERLSYSSTAATEPNLAVSSTDLLYIRGRELVDRASAVRAPFQWAESRWKTSDIQNGADLAGRIVAMYARNPDEDATDERAVGEVVAEKVAVLQAHGAVGIIIVNDRTELLRVGTTFVGASSTVPVVLISLSSSLWLANGVMLAINSKSMSAWLLHLWLVVELLPSQTRHNLTRVNGRWCSNEDYAFAATSDNHDLDFTGNKRRSARFGLPALVSNKRVSDGDVLAHRRGMPLPVPVDPSAPRGAPMALTATPEHLKKETGLTPTPSILRNSVRKTMAGRISGFGENLRRSLRKSISSRRGTQKEQVAERLNAGSPVEVKPRTVLLVEEKLRDPDFPPAKMGKANRTAFG